MQVIREFAKNVKKDGRYVTEVWRQICPCPDDLVCGDLARCKCACLMRWEVETRELQATKFPAAEDDPHLLFDYNAIPPQDYTDMLNMLDLLLQ